MATSWMQLTRLEPMEWLLANGEVVKEPPLEQTTTGRKVRVAGTTESVYQTELPDLLGRAVLDIAAQKQTHVLLNLTDLKSRHEIALGFDPVKAKAILHVVHDTGNRYGKTVAWWRFKHSSMPYEVMLVAQLKNVISHNAPNGQQLDVGFVMPIPQWQHLKPSDTMFIRISDVGWGSLMNAIYYEDSDLAYKWREFVRDEPKQDWLNHLRDPTNYPHQRAAIEALLKVVHDFEELDSIRLPDMRDPKNPSWMEIDLYETNVNSAFVSDLTEYLDGAPMVEKAAELYEQMLQALQASGITVNAKTGNDFMAALLNGEKATLSMEVQNLSAEDGRIDHDHKLSVHLPTGTFVVECSHNMADPNVVAEKWEEALAIATLTGQESELLAFAKGYAADHNKHRTKGIFKDRQVV